MVDQFRARESTAGNTLRENLACPSGLRPHHEDTLKALITAFLPFTLVMLLSIAGAQPGPPGVSGPFQHLSFEQGISHNMIYAILQDRRGFMWFGTMYGLVRYDGVRYRVYRHDPADSTSLSHDDIIALHEDTDGGIWVGTWGGGVSRFDPVVEKFDRLQSAGKPGKEFSSATVWNFQSAELDNRQLIVWMAGGREGLAALLVNRRQKDRPARPAGSVQVYRADAQNAHSLPSSYVSTLYRDRSGMLWVGTGRGLALLRPENFRSGEFDLFIPDSVAGNALPQAHVSAIAEDHSGNLWVGISGRGLFRMSTRERALRQFSAHYQYQRRQPGGLPSDNVRVVREDAQGKLWVGTDRGLAMMEAGEDRFITFQEDPGDPGSLSGNYITALCSDRSGVLWVGSYLGGLDKLAADAGRFTHIGYRPDQPGGLSDRKVTAVFDDGQGALLVGTANGVLHERIPSADERGGQNAFAFRRHRFQQASTAKKTETGGGAAVSAITRAGGYGLDHFWVATSGNGLFLLDLSHDAKIVTHYRSAPQKGSGLSDNMITALLAEVDSAGSPGLWIGTVAGLDFLNPHSGQWVHYHSQPQDSTTLPHNWVLNFYRDHSGRLWIGTYGGLSRFDRKSGRFINFRHHPDRPGSLSNNYVYSVHQSIDRSSGTNTLWVGTADGLNRWNPATADFTVFRQLDGLPNPVICGIIEDNDGYLWLSTQRGVAKFDPHTGRFRNFDVADGLQSNIFNPGVYAGAGERLYLGGINGLNVFRPQQIRDSHFPPPVVVTDIHVGGRRLPHPVQTDTPVRLRYNENDLSFDFAALDFSAPEKNQYAYRLEGLDTRWKLVEGPPQAVYTNLDPGRYLLRLKAANHDGIWNDAETSTEIIITPPFWRTAWFYTLVGMGLLGLMLIAHRRRLKRKVRESLLIERAREMERAWVREKTARDYHDELGHQLTKISLYSELVRRDLQAANGTNGSGPHQTSEYLDKIVNASDRLCNDTRDFIWALNPEADTLYEAAVRLKDFARELFEDFNVSVEISGIAPAFKEINLSMDWRRHVTLIFKEALNNILKHGHASKVWLSFALVGQTLQIRLADNGTGMAADHASSGNGLRNMRKRAGLLNGTIQVDSELGMGTTICFRGRLPEIPSLPES